MTVTPLPFTSYAEFLSQYFKHKIQKLPVDVGFTCPVRDGRISYGGCSFCNGRSFVPDMCTPGHSVRNQLEKGKLFFERKYKHTEVGYLAYFQSGSNTYGNLEQAETYFTEALETPAVEGLVIATRPDCLSIDWFNLLERLAMRTFVLVELGVESVNNVVLQSVGRGHDVEISKKAIVELNRRGIKVGVHTILGLPGETRETMLQQAEWLSKLPVHVLKLHQLQILRGARMADDYQHNPEKYHLFTVDEYVDLVADFIERLSPHIVLERFVSQSPAGSLIAPRWGLKNDVVTLRIVNELKRRGSQQGCKFNG